MLVVISDLHFCDESASQNISPRAFAIWLEEILDLAVHNGAKELELLYLGDVFDLLRTEHWFYPEPTPGDRPAPARLPRGPASKVFADGAWRDRFPLELRPWGDPDINQHPERLPTGCLVRAREILALILEKCATQLALMRCRPDQIADAGFREEPENQALLASIARSLAQLPAPRIRYVAGNHDRLLLVDPELRRMAAGALGIALPEPPRPFYEGPGYGVIARHGHEWDAWNFERPASRERPVEHLSPSDYLGTPLGDPITTELVARLPYEMLHALKQGATGADARSIYEHLQCVEDVRPLRAALDWVLWEGAKHPTRSEAIIETLDQVARELMAHFHALPFVHGWKRLGLDEADKLEIVSWLLGIAGIERLPAFIAAGEALKLVGNDEPKVESACLEKLGAARRYCVYGHTHTFAHQPLSCVDGLDCVYFNSGTWRPRVAQARDGASFHRFKEMTWLVFYRADEDGPKPAGGPSYETWNGLMRKPL